MSSIAPSAVSIQTSPQSVPSIPSWFGEVAIIAHHLTGLGLLDAIAKQVRFARHRFGHYETIDFVAVLVGYTRERGSNARNVLRSPVALRHSVHGLVRTQPPASPLDALSLSCHD